MVLFRGEGQNLQRFEYKKDISDTLPRIVDETAIIKMGERFLGNLEQIKQDTSIDVKMLDNMQNSIDYDDPEPEMTM